MEIGNKIKNLRGAKGITQETLAGALKVSSQAVSKWETGQSTPDIQLLPEIAVYFGVTIDEIYDHTKIDRFFLEKYHNIVDLEEKLKNSPMSEGLFREAKRMGFSDEYLGSHHEPGASLQNAAQPVCRKVAGLSEKTV